MIRALIDRAVRRKRRALKYKVSRDFNLAQGKKYHKITDRMISEHNWNEAKRSLAISVAFRKQSQRMHRKFMSFKPLSWLWLPIARWGERWGYGG